MDRDDVERFVKGLERQIDPNTPVGRELLDFCRFLRKEYNL